VQLADAFADVVFNFNDITVVVACAVIDRKYFGFLFCVTLDDGFFRITFLIRFESNVAFRRAAHSYRPPVNGNAALDGHEASAASDDISDRVVFTLDKRLTVDLRP
jgi:hypothetical protein